MTRARCVFLLVAVAAGCDGEASPVGASAMDAGIVVDATADAAPLSIGVHAGVTYVTGQGEVTGPIDLSHRTIGVWWQAGDDFAFTPASFPRSGDARIEGVPSTFFWLQNGTDYFEGGPGATTFDLVYALLGSGDNLEALTQPTRLSVSLTGLQSWTSAGELVMFSADAGERLRYLDAWLDPPPMDGATAVQGTLDYTQLPERFLIRRGDQTYFLQLADVPGQLFTTRALARHFETTTLMQGDGQPTQVVGELAAAASQTFTVSWADEQFLAASSQVGPQPELPIRYVTVEALPGASVRGRFDSGAPLVELFSSAATSMSGLVTIACADPFPDSWGRTLVGAVWRGTTLPVPGSDQRLFASLTVSAYGTLSAFTDGRIEPLVGPPGEPRVNGQPALTGASGVGTSPVVSWSAPAIGHADVYSIEVRRVDRQDSGLVSPLVARLYTARTEVRLPPELLEAGRSYLLVINAFADPVTTPQRPYQYSQKGGQAQTVAGVVSP